jgi:hypothetical protein
MTKPLNSDSSALLPFAPGELDRSGLRLTRAEFARFLEVSKQAVGEWVTAGKITLSQDGRLDPRQAVSQLLRNSDPARLRSKVLAPLVKNLGGLQRRIAELEAEVAYADEMADFNEEASLEFISQQDTLRQCLCDESVALAKLPADKVIAGVIAWLDAVASGTCDWTVLSIAECIVSTGAPDVKKRGAGEL